MSDDAKVVIDYWATLPIDPDRKIPLRSSFRPAPIARQLPVVFLSEWESESELVVRLAGSKTVDWLTVDMTGRNIFDTIPKNLIESEKRFYAALRDQPCAGYNRRSATARQTKSILYTTILLPLWNDRTGRAAFLGAACGETVAHVIDLKPGDLEFNSVTSVSRQFIDIGYGVPAPLD